MKTKAPRLAALLFAASAAASALAQTVQPPPLPPGSERVRPEPGMSEPERRRAVRAHKRPHPRDYRADDSVPPAGTPKR
ncbi:MAG TPA: hypothetical protein VGD76_10995 [Ramlibacter sp.]